MSKSNMEKWFNTMEKLHDIEPPAFNPNYNPELEIIDDKITKEVNELISICVKSGIKDDDYIDDMADRLRIRLYAIYHRYNYFIMPNGNISHPYPKGKETIKKIKINLI